jgi:hypothetical protein
MDPPSQNQPEENVASQNMDQMESNEAESTNFQKWYLSPTLQKVAYSMFLHTISGAIYGSYSIYLNISKPNLDETQFFIAIGCYLLGIGLYLIFVALYYRVLNCVQIMIREHQLTFSDVSVNSDHNLYTL